MNEVAQGGVGMGVAVLTSALFMSVAAVFIAYFYFRNRFQLKSLDALQSAIDKGSELTPALAEMLEMRSDLRRGVISIAKALACMLLGIAIQVSPARPEDAGDAQAVMWFLFGLAAFPGLFGIALIGFHLAGDRSNSHP
jgi:hypothetical protein